MDISDLYIRGVKNKYIMAINIDKNKTVEKIKHFLNQVKTN